MAQEWNGKELPEALILRARKGDPSALDRLLGVYRNYLKLLARTQIGSGLGVRLEPSDLVQETLLEAHQGFRQFAGNTEREFVAWLRRILVRNLADEVKRQRAQRRDFQRQESLEVMLERSSLAVHEALAAGISSPSEQAVRREQAVLLADALARLPDDYREVILLRHVERLGFEEVAPRMGRSPGAARKLWARAIVKLRSVLEEVSS